MRTGKKATHIDAGTTVIAYVEDSTSFVGVTVPHNDVYTKTNYGAFGDSPSDFVTCLVLGWFTSSDAIPNADVMGRQNMHPFPTFHVERADRVFPYDFRKEIELCKVQAMQWKEMETGISSNLVARHFFPQNARALLLIDMVQHVMNGKGAEERPDWHFWSPGSDFLHLWAVLRSIFPAQVRQPPEQFKEDTSNAYDFVVWDEDPRKIEIRLGFDR